ncbi:MAG: protoporphyrinogen oxidase [Verrucomicrobiota bacterium]|jgi:oxygen-dependent protoporphyrinogen oxidase
MRDAVKKPVAIVGGGITALTAALRLKQQHIPVRIYEAGSRVGGVVGSLRRQGHLAEFGPNSILETSPVIRDLVKDLDLESRRMYSDPGANNRYIVRGKKPVLVPASPGGMVTTPLFSTRAKLRLLLEPLMRRAKPGVDESLARFVRRRLGAEFLDYAINPLVAGIYAGDPAALSVQHAFPKLHALEQKYGSLFIGQVLGARERKRRREVSKQDAPKFSFDEGLQVLIDALRGRLSAEIETAAPVKELEPQCGDWICRPASGAFAPETFSAVLLAVPAYALARLRIKGVPAIDLSLFDQIYYPPVASVVLGFRRQEVGHPLDGFGVLVPERENFHILGALFSSSLFPNRAPAGEVTLTSYIGGARDPGLVAQSEEALATIACRDLAEILNIKGEPTFRHVTLYPRAIPQYNVGFGRFKDRMTALERQAPGVFVAGHCRDGVSLADSIVSGHNVAARIHEFLQTHHQPAIVDLLSAT